jgi:hypothetical protein
MNEHTAHKKACNDNFKNAHCRNKPSVLTRGEFWQTLPPLFWKGMGESQRRGEDTNRHPLPRGFAVGAGLMHLVSSTVLMLLSLLLESLRLHLPKLWSTRSKEGGEPITASLPVAHEERQGIQSDTASLAARIRGSVGENPVRGFLPHSVRAEATGENPVSSLLPRSGV